MKTSPSHGLLHRRFLTKGSKKKGFTLLELVVALVVLGILAALSIPTYESVINSARTDVASASAISAAQDAVAIAALNDGYANESTFTTKVFTADADNGVSEVPGSYSTNGTTSTITLAVDNGGSIEDVTVSWPDQVNGAPTVTSVTPPTTTTTVEGGGGGGTTTTTAPYVEPTCSVTVTGPFEANHIPSAYSLTCSGVTGGALQVDAPVPGGFIYFSVEAANYVYAADPDASLPPIHLDSSFTIDQSYTNPTDDSDPSAPILDTGGYVSDGGYAEFVTSGWAAPFPDNAVGQSYVNYYTGDPCEGSDTGCGTPSVTPTGF
jgi:type IV pilus assembly protein PilE